MGESWTINSETTKKAFIANLDRLYAEHPYITYGAPRIGIDRSLDQNSLFHVFCQEWIAHKLGKHFKRVEKCEVAGMKRTVKKMFYLANPDCSWMIHIIIDYTTGKPRKDYTSSSDWKTGEMFLVLQFMQLEAANQGIILESKGKFAQLQREQNK